MYSKFTFVQKCSDNGVKQKQTSNKGWRIRECMDFQGANIRSHATGLNCKNSVDVGKINVVVVLNCP